MITAPTRRADRIGGDEPIDRSIRPRRGLPGGRAVTGGLLVAVAAVGTFAAIDSAHRPPTTRYLVASHDLRVGQRVRPDDLHGVVVQLPPSLAGQAFRPGAAPIGRFVLAPVEAGELVQASVLGAADRGVPTLSMALDRADGMGGTLLPGDRVDVYLSYGTGATSSTRRILAGAEVVGTGGATESVGASGQIEVALAVPDAAARIDLVNGLHAGKVTLARVTGAAPRTGQTASGDQFAEHDPAAEETVPTTTATPPTTKPASR